MIDSRQIMVEVFKTNVKDKNQADRLVRQIHALFLDYQANFDLEDSDHILRIKCVSGRVESSFLIRLLKDMGCDAEVLPDGDESMNFKIPSKSFNY